MMDDDSWKPSTQSFLQASYPQRTQSMIKYDEPSSPVKLRHSKSDSELDKSHHALFLLKNKNIRQIEIKKEDHTLRTIVWVASLIIFIIFCFDIRADIEKEKHRLEMEATQCRQEYVQNQCDNPVEVMRQKCKEYHVCYSTPASLKLKVSNVVLNLLGQAANTLMGSAGLAGTIFITCLVCAVLFFAYKSSKGVMILKQN